MPRGVYERSEKKAAKKAPAVTKKVVAKKNGKQTKGAKDEVPPVLALSEIELLKMEKLSTQIRACDNDIVIQQSLRQSYIQQIDPSGQIAKYDQKIQALKQERHETSDEYRALSAGIEKRLHIKLSEHAYDDKTGTLRKIGSESDEDVKAQAAS